MKASPSSEKLKIETVGVIVIGSASILGAVVDVERDESGQGREVRILRNFEQKLSSSGVTDFKLYTEQVSKNVSLVVADIVHDKPSRYVVFLPSLLYVGQTRLIHIFKEAPFVVSDKLVHDISINEAEVFGRNHAPLFPDIDGKDNLIFEHELMRIRLNGYEVRSVTEQRASDILIDQYNALGSRLINTRIKERVESESHRPCRLHSATYGLYRAVRNFRKDMKDFIIFDSSGAISDLSVVVDGVIIDHISFPFGAKQLRERVQAKLSTINEEADSILRLHAEGKLNSRAAMMLIETLETIKNEWLFSLRSSFNTILEKHVLPETILMVGEDIISNIFAEWLGDRGLIEFSLSNNPISVKHLNAEFFAPFCQNIGPAIIDNFILAAAAFCAKID